nr:hypothetical protein [Tanacetum cinerariifolium]
MSDSEDSTITYTTVSSPYEGRSGDVSPGVDGPPVILEDPYAYVVAAFQALPPPDYVPGLEEPEQAPPSPIYIPYVLEPVYPEYIPPEDDVFPAEEQPLPAAASPTAESPRYIPESDPDEDSEKDDDEDPEEDPSDYSVDHDDDEEEEEPSGDNADEEDEEQDEDDNDEEEEHPASADSIPPPPALRAGESSIAAAARPIEGRRADYGFVDSVEAEIRRRRAEDIGYGIRDTWIDPRDVAEEEALTTLEGVNTTRVEALVDDSQYHYETGQLVDQEARCSREAWAHSIRLSSVVKDKQVKDKIESKPDKKGKRGEAEKSQKQLQVVPRNYDPKGERFLIASRFPTPPLACTFFSPGATVTDCSCSKGSVEDKILVLKLPKNYSRCAKYGHPVNGPYCQGCTLLREKLEEDRVTYFQKFQNTSESSDDSTNVVNAPREPFVVKKDHGVNPPHIDKCCCECGEALDGIFCQQCTCKSCGKGAHIGYNCPPKVPIISNQEPCIQTMNNELPQTLSSFDTTCYSDKENSVPYVSKPNFVDESSNIFNPPQQPPIYSCEFCRSNAQYGHYCTPQAPFINSEPGYSQDFNFPQNIYDFQQHSRMTLMEQMTTLTSMCEMVCQIFQKKQEEKRIEEEQAANARYWKIPACCDEDDDYNSTITNVLSTEEPDNSLSIGDEHLDTIPATESDKVIKSSVEDLVPILTKDHFDIVINSNNDISSSDDDSLYNENIEYVKESPHDSELVSLEAAEIVIPKVEEIENDNLREKLLNVHLLIANIEALKDNPTPSSELLTKSSSTSPKSFLEETNTFHNSLPEFKNFCFDLGEISSGSTNTHSDISLSDYESFSFDDDHIKEISGGSTTTRSDLSLSEYDSFTFDLLND